MWFKRKVVDKEQPPETKKLIITTELARQLEEQSNAGVLKTDMFEAYLKALIDLHPECQTHPEVVKYMERVKNFLAKKGESA